MLLVQRFADLALSTLRLGFVAQLCGVTEPVVGESGGIKKKKETAVQTINRVVFSPFVTISMPSAHVNGVINFMTLFKFTPKNAPWPVNLVQEQANRGAVKELVSKYDTAFDVNVTPLSASSWLEDAH